MAARSPTLEARRLASPALLTLMGRRTAELGGFALGLLGLALLVAMFDYHPTDPSLNTATTGHTRNLTGPVGAVVADILVQGFGLAAMLPGVALLAWAWRIASRRGLGSPAARIASLLADLPVLAAFFTLCLAPAGIAWPAIVGPGGAIGQLLSESAMSVGRDLAGPLGATCVWIIGFALTLILTFAALGLSTGEWRTAGRGLWRVGRFSVSGGRHAGHAMARGASGVGAASSWVGSMFAGRPGLGFAREPALEPNHPLEVETSTPAPKVIRPEQPNRPERLMAPPVEVPPVATVSALPRVKQPPPSKVKTQQPSLPLTEAGWRFPDLSLLVAPPPRAASGPSEEALQANARLLETVLDDYGVKGAIVEIRPGPVVTLYELEPAPGIRSARVIGLADDVARSLCVTAVRIATVPGRNVIGIEVPNSKRETVYLSEILASDEVQKHTGRLSLALGKDIGGTSIVADLARMPHLMIAGTTGSGKSVGVNAMILSLLYRLSPDQCRLILIDPKMLELSIYEGIPHLMAPVVTEPAKAVTALKWTVREMERRYRAMSQLGVRNIAGYNDRVAEARSKGEVVTRRVQTGFDPDTGRPTFEEQPLALETLPFIVVVVDEMADLMMVAGKEIEAAVQRLAQMARAAGIHVIMATQRPSVDVITGTIKANFPTRISFQVISKFDSRTILGEQGAEQLLGMGDMLFMQGGGRVTRVHGPFVSDDEVEKVVAFLREQGEPAYVEDVTEPTDHDNEPLMSGIAGASDGEKGLFDQAVAVVAREGKASTSFIQRHLNIGYNRAAKLIEQMEKEGIVSTANHVGKREVLVRRTNEDED